MPRHSGIAAICISMHTGLLRHTGTGTGTGGTRTDTGRFGHRIRRMYAPLCLRPVSQAGCAWSAQVSQQDVRVAV